MLWCDDIITTTVHERSLDHCNWRPPTTPTMGDAGVRLKVWQRFDELKIIHSDTYHVPTLHVCDVSILKAAALTGGIIRSLFRL